MTYCYRHLTSEDRAAIMMMRATHSLRAIACHLGHPPSTVSREVARHTVDSIKGYDKRRPRGRGKDRRQQIPDLVSIHMRPPEIEDRLMPGHWEGDLIIGVNNHSAVGTLMTTRLVILAKVDGTTATAAAIGFSDKLNDVPRALRQSMTYD